MAPSPVAYLVGHYPAVSHVFIDREIDGLRRRNVVVETYSLRRTPDADLRSEEHRRAAAATYFVQPPDPTELLLAHMRALTRHPARYVGTLHKAMRLSPGGARHGLFALFYFAEAILLQARWQARGTRHVHVHFANAAAMVALLATRYGGAGWSWSFTMHGPTEFDDVSRYALAEKVRSAAFVACIGDFCRSQLMRLVVPEHWSKLAIVRCGVETGTPARPLTAPASPMTAPASRIRVLCVGRLVPDKGQRLLLDALAAVRDEGVNATLTVVGDGPDREALNRRTKELGLGNAVTFTGAVGPEAMASHYGEADLFCLPSFAEGIPVVLMEAMANELPVLSTRVMGVAELVQDGVSGVLVEPGRADLLAEALLALARDPEARRSLGSRGRQVVLSGFDADVAAGRLLELFEQVSRTNRNAVRGRGTGRLLRRSRRRRGPRSRRGS